MVVVFSCFFKVWRVPGRDTFSKNSSNQLGPNHKTRAWADKPKIMQKLPLLHLNVKFSSPGRAQAPLTYYVMCEEICPQTALLWDYFCLYTWQNLPAWIFIPCPNKTTNLSMLKQPQLWEMTPHGFLICCKLKLHFNNYSWCCSWLKTHQEVNAFWFPNRESQFSGCRVSVMQDEKS